MTITIEDRHYLPGEADDVETTCVVEVDRLGYPDECGAVCDDGPICGAHMGDVNAGVIAYETYRRYLTHASA